MVSQGNLSWNKVECLIIWWWFYANEFRIPEKEKGELYHVKSEALKACLDTLGKKSGDSPGGFGCHGTGGNQVLVVLNTVEVKWENWRNGPTTNELVISRARSLICVYHSRIMPTMEERESFSRNVIRYFFFFFFFSLKTDRYFGSENRIYIFRMLTITL